MGLASFGIYFLSVKGYKLVDGSLSASAVLCDMQLDDTRPERINFITKFMKKRQDTTVGANKPDPSMLDVVARITDAEIFSKAYGLRNKLQID